MRFLRRWGAVIPALVLSLSCAPGAPQLMPMETLFTLDLGTMEDQIDLFQRADQTAPERNRFLFYNGLVVVSDGNARKVMEFSSYGDLLTLFYNADSNPTPAMLGPSTAATAAGAASGVQNRRAFAYPFDELGELALTGQNQLYVEDRVPAERRAYEPTLDAVLQSRVLRFDREGKFLDFLGQEGIGGTPFPMVDRLTVTANNELAVLCRTGKGWAIWWYDAAGNPIDKAEIAQSPDVLPQPDGSTGSSFIPQLETVIPDWKDRVLHVKIDYYRRTADQSAPRTDASFQQAQSRIWTWDLASRTFRKSYALPTLKRQKTTGDATEPAGDRPYEFVGVSESGLGFFLSSPENRSLRFLVCRPDGSTVLERNVVAGGADALFAQYSVTRTGTLVGFLSDGNKAQIAWWRSDKLLGTNATAGF